MSITTATKVYNVQIDEARLVHFRHKGTYLGDNVDGFKADAQHRFLQRLDNLKATNELIVSISEEVPFKHQDALEQLLFERNERKVAEAQRDQLLAALKALLASTKFYGYRWNTMAAAEHAINSVEGAKR